MPVHREGTWYGRLPGAVHRDRCWCFSYIGTCSNVPFVVLLSFAALLYMGYTGDGGVQNFCTSFCCRYSGAALVQSVFVHGVRT